MFDFYISIRLKSNNCLIFSNSGSVKEQKYKWLCALFDFERKGKRDILKILNKKTLLKNTINEAYIKKIE